jgi:orotidine-5'-phosphate decarboxylase
MIARPDIPARDRLILALDVPDPGTARQLVETLGEEVTFYKIGLQLFVTEGFFDLATWLTHRGKRVFADLKLFDIPRTVAAAVRQFNGRDVSFLTVHGNDAMLKAASDAAQDPLKILAVTALTSLDEQDMADLGFQTDVTSLVVSRARRAVQLGCGGVIASGHEIEPIRAAVGQALLIVVPGIRPAANQPLDDQKRTLDVEEAFRRGADHIVVGRPIRGAPDPRAAARDMQQRIGAIFKG